MDEPFTYHSSMFQIFEVQNSCLFTGYLRLTFFSDHGSHPYYQWMFNSHDFIYQNSMTAIWQTTFLNVFSRQKMSRFQAKFYCNTFLVQATSHYLNQWWSSPLSHICVTRYQGVKCASVFGQRGLFIWKRLLTVCDLVTPYGVWRSCSTLVRVMVWYLTA